MAYLPVPAFTLYVLGQTLAGSYNTVKVQYNAGMIFDGWLEVVSGSFMDRYKSNAEAEIKKSKICT